MKEMIKRVREEKGGFTLAELLIVVAIVLVLVAIAIPVFTGAMDSANRSVDAANIRSGYAQAQTWAMQGKGIDGKDLTADTTYTLTKDAGLATDAANAYVTKGAGAGATDMPLNFNTWTKDQTITYVIKKPTAAGSTAWTVEIKSAAKA